MFLNAVKGYENTTAMFERLVGVIKWCYIDADRTHQPRRLSVTPVAARRGRRDEISRIW